MAAETFDDWRRKVSDKVGEPVLALMAVQPRGAAGAGGASIGLSKISPLAGMVISKAQGDKSNPNAGGLGQITAFRTKSALLGVTAEQIHVFEVKQGFGGLKLKDPIYVWDRRDVTMTAEAKKMTAAIDISLASGERFEVETMLLGENARMIDEVLAELAKDRA